MLDIASSELLLIAVVALVVIGPRDLPRALYRLGRMLAKGRSVMAQVRSGADAMMREAELVDLERNFVAHGDHIQAQHDMPLLPLQFEADDGDGLPLVDGAAPALPVHAGPAPAAQ